MIVSCRLISPPLARKSAACTAAANNMLHFWRRLLRICLIAKTESFVGAAPVERQDNHAITLYGQVRALPLAEWQDARRMYSHMLALMRLVDKKQANGAMLSILCGKDAYGALCVLQGHNIVLEPGKQLHRAQHGCLDEPILREERIGSVNAFRREEGNVLNLVIHELAERLSPPQRSQVLRRDVLTRIGIDLGECYGQILTEGLPDELAQ